MNATQGSEITSSLHSRACAVGQNDTARTSALTCDFGSRNTVNAKIFLWSPRVRVVRASRRERIKNSEEGHMCPACIESTALMVAGVASGGGILTVCIDKLRKFLKASSLGLFQKTKEK